ncbi:MAG TPA: nuclear transport factor 2 family protein [Gammaproteobacteria bacterium]|nr:nuclear transport factor 2 family protein [Gammaproteobacteria bacterium]
MSPVRLRPSLSLWFALGFAAAALPPGLASAQNVTPAAVAAWLAKYEAAWEQRSPDQAAQLFTENATYRETPFQDPMKGRAGIRKYWTDVTADQRSIAFKSDVIAVQANVGVAHWSATFNTASTGDKVELDGVFVLTFDASGLVSSLREWWHLPEAK